MRTKRLFALLFGAFVFMTHISYSSQALRLKENNLNSTFSLNWSTGTFNEKYAENDGSIGNTIELTLVDEQFVISSGDFVENTHYTIANLPAGLTLVITANDATTATVSITGNATNHESADDVNDLTITFLDAAFVGGNAASISNSSKSNLIINFYDPFDLSVVNILQPVEYQCSYTNAENIEVTIMNWGNEEFDFSQENLIIETVISGEVNITLWDTINSGTLASMSSLDYTLSESLDMSVQGEYTIDITTHITNDEGPFNDTYGIYIPYTLPVVDLGNNQTVCAGSSVQFDAANPGSSYSWSTSGTDRYETIDSTGVGLGSVDVHVTVTLNGCSDIDTVTVTFVAEPNFDLGSPISLCTNTSQTLNPGLSNVDYLWSTNNTTATLTLDNSNINVGTTNVSLTVTDANNCTAIDTVAVTMNNIPTADAGTGSSIACGGSIQIGTASVVGNTYIWTPATGLDNASIAEPTASPSLTTTYTLEVTNTTTGCINTDDITITITNTPNPAFSGDSEICYGESATLVVSGGSSYEWNTSETNDTIIVSPTETTVYTVTVTDGSCSEVATVTLTVKPLPSIDLGQDRSICANTNETLDAGNPSASYLWSTLATTQTITVDSAGTGLSTLPVSVTVTDNGCQNTASVNLTFIGTPQVALGNDVVLCPNQNYVLYTSITDAEYLWSSGDTTISITVDTTSLNIGNNTISLVVTDTNGCIGTDIVTVTVNPVPVTNAGVDVAINCGDNVQLGSASQQYLVYNWTPSTYLDDSTLAQPTATPLMETTYTLTVLDTITGCSNTDDVHVSINNLPVAAITGNNSVCEGNFVTLIATGGSSYTWSTLENNDTITVYPSSTTTYYVTVSESNCSAVASFTVNYIENPVVTLGNDIEICSNSSANLSAGSNFDTYLWSTGDTTSTITVDTTGYGFGNNTVSVTVTDNGCSASDEIIISVKPLPTIELGSDVENCISLPVTIDAGVAEGYLWSTGDTTQTIVVDTTLLGGVTGQIFITITDECGITASDSIGITFTPDPVVDFGQDTVYTSQPDTIVYTATGFDTYLWHDGSTTNTFNVSGYGWVVLNVTHNGCSASDSVLIARGYDLSVLAITNPNSECTLGSAEEIRISIKNSGNLPVPQGDTVYVYYKVNSGNIVGDVLVLEEDFLVNATEIYTFSTTANMSASGQYNVKAYLSYSQDNTFANDTVYRTINNWGTPVVNLGSDAVLCDNTPATLEAGQGVGYVYLWSTGQTSHSIVVDTTGNGFNNPVTYSVTVSNGGGCTSTDAITLTWEQCNGCVACEGESQSGSNGWFRIGQFGEEFAHDLTYCANANCSWTVVSNTGMHKIGITFDYFDIRYGDYLTVYKGHTANAGNLIGSYNIISMPPAMIYVPSDSCLVTFTSDNSVEGFGTLLRWNGFGIGIDETGSIDDCFIYPNPAKSFINVKLTAGFGANAEVSIINTLGQKVIQTTVVNNMGSIDVQNLQKGIYYIQIKGNDKTISKTISIQ